MYFLDTDFGEVALIRIKITSIKQLLWVPYSSKYYCAIMLL